jgi:uncharacterized protein YidB (DUF937 family)
MSLLGNILGSALGGGNSGDNSGSGQNALLSAVLGMVNQHGGVEGLAQKFAGSGLSHVFSSWVAPGQNQSVSPDQILQVFGHDHVGQIAQQAGVEHSEAASGIAQLLPAIIDKLTPGGQVPTGGDLQQKLSGLLSGGLGNLLK